jgi:endonuclease/exonuclease/phosphatase family metal-dependent hydrolase
VTVGPFTRLLLLVTAITLGVVSVAAFAAGLLLWFPADIEPVPLSCTQDAQPAPRGTALKVMVWNVQFGAGRKHHFFYDGGEAVFVPASDVEDTLDAIAEVVRTHDPDIILWQEVDRSSDRTARIDQLQGLLDRTPYACQASTPYHRAGYVPHPAEQHLGKVDMHLAVFSKYQLTDATRHQLPLLDEPWWRKAFNLRRALLDVRLAVEGGGSARLLNTHLSAFSKGDGTLEKQVAMLNRHAAQAEHAKVPWLLAGDLNALPPGDDPSRLGADSVWYQGDVTQVQPLFDRFNSVIPAEHYVAESERWRTYVPFGAEEPDRTLDYMFAGRTVGVGDVQVLQELSISDHLPLLVEITLP